MNYACDMKAHLVVSCDGSRILIRRDRLRLIETWKKYEFQEFSIGGSRNKFRASSPAEIRGRHPETKPKTRLDLALVLRQREQQRNNRH